MDGHRFRMTVFHRDMLELWITLISSQDSPGHSQASETLEEAFKLGKGFIKFGYLDGRKNVHVPRRLSIKQFPQFCIFHPSGQTCMNSTMTARELVNMASSYLPDFCQKVDSKWFSEPDIPVAILFTEKKNTPNLWAAISYHFKPHPIRIGKSDDQELAAKFGITTLPAIVMKNMTHTIVYEGDNEFLPLKDTLKKFSQKKLMKIRKSLRVYPLKDFEENCKGQDTVCLVHASEELSQEFEIYRKKHTTSMLEFFYGLENLPHPAMKTGSVFAIRKSTNEYIEMKSLEELSTVVPKILEKTATWSQDEL